MGKHTPKLSVVITAHNRRKFVRAAVDSVLSQSLARSEYEVIVVKNFRDQNLDRYFAKKNVLNVYTDSESLGAKVSEGLRCSTGELVCFLEDDDMFAPNKLVRIKSLFAEYPDVVMIRNNLAHIDAAGNLIGSEKLSPKRAYVIRNPQSVLDALPRLGAHKNLSCMSVRIEPFTNYFDLYRRIKAADIFTFCVASKLGDVLVTPEILTYYRLHQESATSLVTRSYGDFVSQAVFEDQVRDRLLMLKLLRGSPSDRLLRRLACWHIAEGILKSKDFKPPLHVTCNPTELMRFLVGEDGYAFMLTYPLRIIFRILLPSLYWSYYKTTYYKRRDYFNSHGTR